MPTHFGDNYIARYATTTAVDGNNTYAYSPTAPYAYTIGDWDGDDLATSLPSFNFGQLFLSEQSKAVLKPFIEEILREILEREGYIVGRLPKEEPGEI